MKFLFPFLFLLLSACQYFSSEESLLSNLDPSDIGTGEKLVLHQRSTDAILQLEKVDVGRYKVLGESFPAKEIRTYKVTKSNALLLAEVVPRKTGGEFKYYFFDANSNFVNIFRMETLELAKAVRADCAEIESASLLSSCGVLGLNIPLNDLDELKNAVDYYIGNWPPKISTSLRYFDASVSEHRAQLSQLLAKINAKTNLEKTVRVITVGQNSAIGMKRIMPVCLDIELTKVHFENRGFLVSPPIKRVNRGTVDYMKNFISNHSFAVSGTCFEALSETIAEMKLGKLSVVETFSVE